MEEAKVRDMNKLFFMLNLLLFPITIPLYCYIYIKARFFPDKIHDNDK